MTENRIIKTSEQFFSDKKSRRAALAAKSVEEKLEMLINLQRMKSQILKNTGRPYQEPWNIEIAKRDHH